jgi:transcriptional regulator with XRE-family HTH domain
LAYARKFSGFKTCFDFSEFCQVTAVGYRNHETGCSEPRISFVMTYSYCLDFPLKWFFWGVGAPTFHVNSRDKNVTKIKQNVSEQIRDVGIRLKCAREASGHKSQEEFARLCGIGRSALSRHESGRVEMGIYAAKKYCEFLDISVDWLMTGNGNPFDHNPHDKRDPNAFDTYLSYFKLKTSSSVDTK